MLPLSIFLIIYYLFLVVFVVFVFINIYHIVISASLTTVSFSFTFFIITAGVLTVYGTWALLQGVDLSQPLIEFGNTLNSF